MTDATTPLILLAAGGTGGHVFPAEAVAAELLARGHRLALVTDRRGAAMGGALGQLPTHPVRAGGIAGLGAGRRILAVGELAWGTAQAFRLIRRLRPGVVAGFGGYASVPPVAAALLARRPTLIHEQNAVLGRANRLFAGHVDRVALSLERSTGLSAAARARAVHTGMPVRPAVAAVRDAPYPEPDMEGPLRLLVVGGSQGARVFSDVIPAAVGRLRPDLRRRLHVVQQARPEDVDRTRAAYEEAGVAADTRPFIDDLPDRLAAAHLVIGRAGASTLAEVTTVGRPAILVPFPYAADDHQRANAQALDEAGGGWLLPQDTFTADTLAGRLQDLLDMPTSLTKAAACARAVGRPDAARALADHITALARGEAAPAGTTEEAAP